MSDKWRSLVDRICQTCGAGFRVQYQSTKAKGGARYCSRKCSPNNYRAPTRNPLGSTHAVVDYECAGCHSIFKTKVKNLNRGQGRYCSRKCNPAYAAKHAATYRHWKQNLKKYGLTPDSYSDLSSKHAGGCAICGTPANVQPRWGKLYVDHCHKTGHVRGMLCGKCNTGIGMFNDDPERLVRAAHYLIAAMRAKGFAPQTDNDADALALLLCVMDEKVPA